ncbi:MAG TPA: hypothetical protein VKD72_30250, partial [Gemmataceae bacterium]|nr:hypothetical protein [Gemmataceae bacterium]
LSYSAGVVASVVLALYPFHVFIETYGRQETVYGVLLSMFLFLTWLRLRETGWQSRRDVLLFAFLTGLAALTSPQLILLTGLALLFDFATRAGQRLRVFQAGVVVALVGAVMIAPWVYRNYVALGGFVPLRDNFGLELFIGNNPESDGHTYTIPYAHPEDRYAWPHPFNHPGERQRVHDLGELAYMREKGDMAREWIREHPSQFAGLTLRRVGLYWFPPVSTWNPKLAAKWPRSLAAWVLSAACLCGLFLVFRHRHPNRWPLLIVLLAPSLVYLVTHVNVRYRYSTVWTMALLAGYAATCLAERLRRRGDSLPPARLETLRRRRRDHPVLPTGLKTLEPVSEIR